ncbi:MAG: aminomethyl transferase family protein [Thermodesulfobacteriota bacterium]
MDLGSDNLKTPLHGWHTSHGATMAPFRGWEMPLWYPSGAVAEHLAVIEGCGMFDTSHMSVISLIGPGSFDLLQSCFTRDLDSWRQRNGGPPRSGRAAFGAFLNDLGHVIDDAVVFFLALDTYLVVVNAGKGEEVCSHLAACKGSHVFELDDLTGKIGKIDLQGPNSARILAKVLHEPERALLPMSYFSFKGHFDEDSPLADVFLKNGAAVLVSRTGYTGEFGFELFVRSAMLGDTWELILAAGKEFGLIPCGLAARDSLRAGAVLPLSGQDIGSWPFINHPWPHALPFNEDGTGFTKDFLGDVVLGKRNSAEHTQAFAGYDPRKVSVHDPAVVLGPDGTDLGIVLTCVADMAIGRVGNRIYSVVSPDKPDGFKAKGLSCGFVRVRHRLPLGQVVELKDKRRKIRVEIVEDIRPDRTALRPMSLMIERRGVGSDERDS